MEAIFPNWQENVAFMFERSLEELQPALGKVNADLRKAEQEKQTASGALQEAQEVDSWWKEESAQDGSAGADGDDDDQAAGEKEQLKAATAKASAIGFCAKMLAQLIAAKGGPPA